MKKVFFIFIILMVSLVSYAQIYTSYKIYGGANHKEYLGKWASKYDGESIWNKYSDYGSKYNSKSIWNKYGNYGSRYGSYSPWNAYSSEPPVLVDEYGRVVDYLSRGMKASSKMRNLMEYVFQHFDEVAADPNEFYDQYF